MGKALLFIGAVAFLASLLCLLILLGAYFVTDYFGVGSEPTRVATKSPTASLTKPAATATFTPLLTATPTRQAINSPTRAPTKKVVVSRTATVVPPTAKPTPFLASVFPPYGPKDGRVWLKGSNLGESSGKVYFWCYGKPESIDAGVLSWSSTEVVAITPKLRQAGHCAIRVVNSEWLYSNEVFFTIETPVTETPIPNTLEPTVVVTATSTRTSTPTATSTRTPTRTSTPSSTATRTLTLTPTPSVTASRTLTATATRTVTATVTPTR